MKIDEVRNPTVLGLDPDLEHIPKEILEKYVHQHGEGLEAAALAVYDWGTALIDALCDIVPAVKPQSAFYEQLGSIGVMALKRTCDYARAKGLYVILDAKRGDIGSTAAAYSSAYLGAVKVGNLSVAPFDVDALTVNAYLGSDGIKPFIETAVQFDKAVFALVKTSNPSAGELQDKLVKGTDERFYSLVGDLIADISKEYLDEAGFSRVGAVVGATYPEEAAFLRARLKNTFFLVPGYGAQGGTAEDVAVAFNEERKGAIVNSSRGIIAAWKKRGGSYTEAARDAAFEMRSELRKAVY
ncbi:MAG: orotidine-5'-phosphate decarboxylase [Oscillospiraceae bacterium]|nr:orotidine-5'-phosphate decarboxylase [Oscillospiraceae bacterium]MCL2278691.1 orotidine-5'-phosphate decarboxylase [Oscillospiraceae bacterium]